MITRNAPYFKDIPLSNGQDAPLPLSCSVDRDVRFEEVDAMGVVWHGRYPSYFEDGRVAFGKKYGFEYLDIYAAGLVIPVKQMGIDYIAPLHFGERCRICATLHWTEAARLNFSYAITDMSGSLLATGYTVHLFLTIDQDLCMDRPKFYLAFCNKWLSGVLLDAKQA